VCLAVPALQQVQRVEGRRRRRQLVDPPFGAERGQGTGECPGGGALAPFEVVDGADRHVGPIRQLGLGEPGCDAARSLLEESVAGAYRDGRLTMEQVRELPGLPTRMHVDVFLQRHAIYEYTAEDLNADMATLDRVFSVSSR